MSEGDCRAAGCPKWTGLRHLHWLKRQLTATKRCTLHAGDPTRLPCSKRNALPPRLPSVASFKCTRLSQDHGGVQRHVGCRSMAKHDMPLVYSPPSSCLVRPTQAKHEQLDPPRPPETTTRKSDDMHVCVTAHRMPLGSSALSVATEPHNSQLPPPS